MKPRDDDMNGHESGSGGARSDDSEGEEASALEEELSLVDAGAPARLLAALNALRKARQHYDVLVAGSDGEEVAAHRAVLAAASPRLLAALPAAGGPGPTGALRLPDVETEALRELVEYAYTGRLRVRDAAGALRLYRAAARLRVEAARAHLAERLVRRAAPHDVLLVRALPDLQRHHRAALDAYIAHHFDEICACGALSALPLVRIELLRETSSERGEEPPAAVAAAALRWLREQCALAAQAAPASPTSPLEELCTRTHLLFVDAGGALRDCGELPASRGDAPELTEYRREAAERERGVRKRANERAEQPERTERAEGEERTEEEREAGDTGVVAARAGGAGVTRALLALRGRLAAARVAWRAGAGGAARGGPLGGADEGPPEPADAPRLAHMSVPRCALGAAALAGRLLVCGGYDRARVLRCAEAYDPVTNAWTPLPEMRGPRARFPAVELGGALYALGGSDGHAELSSVDAFTDGAWRARSALPLARSHAAAAADPERGVLYVAGGWAGGRSLRQVHCYSPLTDQWTEAPSLITGRSQCAGVVWAGAAWVLGGCDAWRCLASTERLGARGWTEGPALPTARRSVGGAVWRGRLLAAGGSSGGASLRHTAWLAQDAPAWREGPPLREARAAPALCVLRDVLYAAGGFSGQEFLASVECLYEPDGCWTSLWAGPAPAAGPSPALSDAAPPSERCEPALNGDRAGGAAGSERDGAIQDAREQERDGRKKCDPRQQVAEADAAPVTC
ncbi:influenza virus NS1A-binding protein homolog B-like isoform X2 [Battus philenor]|uniref:influenza virus NS1A-binding protein homolog B-like isoform X2 n=1 Tax=Battus philenor TaxID=42288 RepID=UPI0035D12F88